MRETTRRLLWLIGAAVLICNSAAAAQNAKKPLPSQLRGQTAISPVYDISSKSCRNRDDAADEGDEFYRDCPGFGDYRLVVTGSDYRRNYGIAAKNRAANFEVMLFPLGDGGAAAKYERADLYDEKLARTIEWQLDERGKPFAVVVRAAFYKNTGSAKTFANPKNKAAEFYLVRGLIGFEDLKADLPVAETPFNPLEQARALAARYLEDKRRKD